MTDKQFARRLAKLICRHQAHSFLSKIYYKNIRSVCKAVNFTKLAIYCNRNIYRVL